MHIIFDIFFLSKILWKILDLSQKIIFANESESQIKINTWLRNPAANN